MYLCLDRLMITITYIDQPDHLVTVKHCTHQGGARSRVATYDGDDDEDDNGDVNGWNS